MEFVDWLKEQMDRNGWTQEDFSSRAGLPSSTFNAYLTRKTKPMPDKLRGFADATGTSMRRLLIICNFAKESDFRAKALSEKEEELLYWYRQVPLHQKDLVVAMLRSGIRSLEDQGGRPELPGGDEILGTG